MGKFRPRGKNIKVWEVQFGDGVLVVDTMDFLSDILIHDLNLGESVTIVRKEISEDEFWSLPIEGDVRIRHSE